MSPGDRVRIAHEPYLLDRLVSGATGELLSLDEDDDNAMVRLDDERLAPFAPRRCPRTGRPVAQVFAHNVLPLEDEAEK
jgi:hypothetical protein